MKLRFSRLILVIFLALALAGCITTKPEETAAVPSLPDCSIPAGHNVAKAFQEAQEMLSDPECSYQFDSSMVSLRRIAKGDPKPENKQLFSNFLVWSKGNLISTVEAERQYRRYFDHRFTTLPKDGATCSYCRRQNDIIADMKIEKADKKEGLVDICEDRTTFNLANQQYNSIVLQLEAICQACSDNEL